MTMQAAPVAVPAEIPGWDGAKALCDALPAPVEAVTPACQALGVADGVGAGTLEVIDFASDPFGRIAQLLQEFVGGIAAELLPSLVDATQPDLSADFFISSWKMTFTLALLIFAVLIFWNFYLYSKEKISGDDVVETLALYTPMFVLGAMFGPAIGIVIVGFFGALTDMLAQWAFGTTADQATASIITLANEAANGRQLETGESVQIVGGTFAAIFVLTVMAVALIGLLVIFVVQLVTLYLSGVLIPMNLVWLLHPTMREKGWKIVQFWIGVLAMQPLMMLMLGVAFNMIIGLSFIWAGKDGLRLLVDLLVAGLVMMAVVMSPFFLMKWGKSILPVGSGGNTDGGGSSGRPLGDYKGDSEGTSQMGRMSAEHQRPMDSGPPQGSSPVSAGTGSGTEASPQSAQASSRSAGASGGRPPVPVGSGSASGAGSTTGGAGAGAAGGSSGAAAGGAGAGAAGGSASTAAAGGAAASGSTGVGLPVAAALTVASAGLKAKEYAEKGVDEADRQADEL